MRISAREACVKPHLRTGSDINEITLYAEFFLVIDILPVFNYSDNRKEWSSGLVLCV